MTEEPIAPRARRGRGRNGDAEDDSAIWAQRKGRRKRDGRGKGADGLPLHIELPDGSEYDVTLDLSQCMDLPALQRLVIEQWVAAGGSRQDGVMMQYLERGSPGFLKVTRSTTIELLREARALHLQAKQNIQPRHPSSRRAAAPGRTQRFS